MIRYFSTILLTLTAATTFAQRGPIIPQPSFTLPFVGVAFDAGPSFSTNSTQIQLGATITPLNSYLYEWSVVSRPPGALVAFSSATALNTQANVDLNGNYIFEIVARKGARRISDTVQVGVNVTVNQAPTITAIPDTTVNEDQTANSPSFTLADDTTPVGSLTVLPIVTYGNDRVQVISVIGAGATRTLQIVPKANSNGVVQVTVSVSDAQGASASSTAQFTFLAQNDFPILAAIGTQNTTEDVAKVVNLSATDPETASPTFSAISNDQTLLPASGISIVGNVMTLTPAANRFGTNTVLVTVSDGSGGTDSETVTFGVASQNDIPTISSPADPNPFPAGTPFEVAYLAFDIEDGGNMTYTRATDNAGVVPLANIVLSGGTSSNRIATITGASAGTANVTLTAQDSNGASVQTVIAVTISGTPNTSPSITPPGNVTVFKNQPTGTLTATVNDAETPVGQLVVWAALSSNPSLIPTNNVTITGSTGTRNIVATPISNVTGTVTITLRVRDGGSAEAAGSFSVTVSPTNYPPVISQPSPQTMNEDGSLNIVVNVSDPDHATTALTTSGTSSQPSIVQNSGVNSSGTGTQRTFAITPVPNAFGSLVLTLQVSDGSATAQVNVNLTVNSQNDPPQMTPLSNISMALGDTPPTQNTSLSDVESAVATLSLSGTSSNPTLVQNSGIQFTGAGATRGITVNPQAGQSGTAIITIVVTDPQGGSSSRQFSITVSGPGGSGTDWYVSTTGSGASANGTNIATPISLSAALSGNGGRILPGHTAHLRGGSYNGTFSTSLSGNAGNRITFRNFANEVPFLDANDDGAGNVLLFNGNYIDFVGINFRNSAPREGENERGAQVYSTAGGHRRFLYCTAANLENGFAPQTKLTGEGGDLFYGCVSYYNGYRSAGDNKGHGMYIQNGGNDSVIVDKSVLAYNCDNGIQFYSTDGATPMRNFTCRRSFFLMWGRMINLSGTEGIGLTTQANTVMSNIRIHTNYFWGEPSFSSTAIRTSGNSVAGQDIQVDGNNIYNGAVGIEWPTPGWSTGTFRGNNFFVGVTGGGLDQVRYSSSVSSRTFQNNTYRGANSFAPGGDFNGYVASVGETGSSYAAGDPGQLIVVMPLNDFPTIQHAFKAILYVRTTSAVNPLSIDISAAGLPIGAAYRILKQNNMFSGLVAGSGTYTGNPVSVNMAAVPMAAPAGLPLPENSAVSFGGRTQVADVFIIASP